MDCQKKVSIIVPVYQVAEYLNKCVMSICEQTYSNLEIILIDDGSTDGSSQMCDEFEKKDIRIAVIHKKNGGLSSARNAGLKVAKGDYVAFVDSDDYIHPAYIETLLRSCEEYKCEIAVCDYMSVRDDIDPLPLNKHERVTCMNSRDTMHALTVDRYLLFIVCWNKLYKRELFDDILFPDGRIHEDEYVTHHLLYKSKNTVLINQYLYYYRKRANSIMSRPFSEKNFDRIYGTMDRLHLLKKEGLEEEYRSTVKRLSFLIEQAEKYCKINKANDSLSMLDEIKNLFNEFDVSDRSDNTTINRKIRDVDTSNISGKIVIYGAGDVGRAIFEKLGEEAVSGWIDNLWYKIQDTDIAIKPVYELLNMEYDYVCITQRDSEVRNEVKQQILSWGVSPSKIVMAITNKDVVSIIK